MTPEVQELVEAVQRMMADALSGLVPVNGLNAQVAGAPPFVILSPLEGGAGAGTGYGDGESAGTVDRPTLRGFYAT